MEGGRSHLKAMKDLTAGEARNDNVCEGMQQTKSPIISGILKLFSLLCMHFPLNLELGITVLWIGAI